MKNPCEKCEERTVSPNCHTNCTAYKKWNDERKKEKEKLKEDCQTLKDQESWMRFKQEGRKTK